MGTTGSAELRKKEAEAASEALGLAIRRNAGLPDAGLRNTLEARRTVASIIRELRPRIVVTHWTRGRHPDHRVTARIVRDSAFLAGLKRFEAGGDAHRPMKVVHATSFRENAPHPTFVVDISAQMKRKLRAIACYDSQFKNRTGAGEVYPGGDRTLFDQIRSRNAVYGSLIRVEYGEPFFTPETMAVHSLGDLSVSTF